MEKFIRFLSAGLFLIFLVVTGCSRVYAEQKDGDVLMQELVTYMEQNYQDIFAQVGYGEAAEDIGIGRPYYIYSESGSLNIGRYF